MTIRKSLFVVLMLSLVFTGAVLGESRFQELLREREAHHRAELGQDAPTARFCVHCGADFTTQPGGAFCSNCGNPREGGAAVSETAVVPADDPADRVPAAWAPYVGYWVARPDIVALPVHDDVYCHVAQIHVLHLYPRDGRLCGRYTYTDYRRLYETPSLHRNDIEERQEAKEFVVDAVQPELTFGFDAFLHNKVFRRSARVTFKRHYVWTFTLHPSEDGAALDGIGERGFYRERVHFVRVPDEDGAWLLNQRNRRGALEEDLGRVRRTVRADMSALADSVEGAAMSRLVQALATREVWFFDDRDALLGDVSSLKLENNRLRKALKELEGH